MNDEMEPINLHRLLTENGGPPPGYLWGVEAFPQVRHEAVKVISDDQFRHIADQVKELARLKEPSKSELVDVRRVDNMYELRDSGGELRNLNVRLFFYIDKSRNVLVLLGFFKKKTDGPTPRVDKLRMKTRLNRYRRDHPGS